MSLTRTGRQKIEESISYNPTEAAAMHEHVENRNGVYYIPGTRISLDSIVYAFRQGSSSESIREDFNGLTLPHVCGAIAFYLDNQEKVDAYLAAQIEKWQELERQGTPLNPDLQARLESARKSSAAG